MLLPPYTTKPSRFECHKHVGSLESERARGHRLDLLGKNVLHKNAPATSAVSLTISVVSTQLCKLRDISAARFYMPFPRSGQYEVCRHFRLFFNLHS